MLAHASVVLVANLIQKVWVAATGIMMVILLVGCRSAQQFYPIGLYSVPSTNDFALVRDAGFNTITTALDRHCLDMA